MRVGLLVTCLVDLIRPRIGFAALTLLESAGYDVHVPHSQTCCGQPGFNSGDRASARALAEKLIEEFEDFGPVQLFKSSFTKSWKRVLEIIKERRAKL